MKITSRNSDATSPAISRRSLLIGAGATAGAAGIAGVWPRSGGVQAQQSPATPNPIGSPVPVEATPVAGNWPMAQADYYATRSAYQSPITSSTVSQLGIAWTTPITVSGNFSGITATPVIIDGVAYIQDGQSNVFALDVATGKQLWITNYNSPSNGPNGVAVAYGRLFAATGDSSIAFCLDPKTGKEIWRNDLSNSNFECIDMAPAVFNNLVYISTNPNNVTNGNYHGGARGILYALDVETGVTIWSFDTSTDNLWNAPRLNSGAGLWYPPSIDANGNLYIGTGNAGPYPGTADYPNGSSRQGDNDYASSMISLDPNTGGVRWHVNAAPHDIFDHDFQESPVLCDLPIGSVETLVAIGAGKTGTVIAADATSGRELWRVSVGKHQNDTITALPSGTTEVFPGTLGGVESPLAYANGTVFVPYLNLPSYSTPDGTRSSQRANIADGTGGLVALNAIDGTVKWEVDLHAMCVSGATVANDLVFAGGMDGVFHAYNVETGEEVWNMQTQGGLNCPPAIAGDLIMLPAGGPIFKPSAGPAGTPSTPVTEQQNQATQGNIQPNPMIFALKLGATGTPPPMATPAATPAA